MLIKDICDGIDVDYQNVVLNNLKTRQQTEGTFNNVSIAIASAVTSYARIHMNSIKLNILNKGNCIYYSETDSIVTNKPLDISLIGKELGLFKLEHKVKIGYFITSKTYCLVLSDGLVIKAKGINNNDLTEKEFKTLLKGDIVRTNRTESTKDFQEAYVNIKLRDINLRGNSYTKRTKVYNNNT